ncbi:hypothetical protein C8D87_11461 [Lentzea atacamensis]|uniref:Uncharacterized protein n=1 Tax=Lentzea atacamensis TaxID=531938 RepID=A0ABX9DYE2_9PSEU|nr:hypothetical protein [Lentzea atacamensis]RAS59449.1 hypothetical protein C8D87_11461 [Lentzea atacamensis]
MTAAARPLRQRLAVAALLVLYLAAAVVDAVRRRVGGRRAPIEKEVL